MMRFYIGSDGDRIYLGNETLMPVVEFIQMAEYKTGMHFLYDDEVLYYTEFDHLVSYLYSSSIHTQGYY